MPKWHKCKSWAPSITIVCPPVPLHKIYIFLLLKCAATLGLDVSFKFPSTMLWNASYDWLMIFTFYANYLLRSLTSGSLLDRCVANIWTNFNKMKTAQNPPLIHRHPHIGQRSRSNKVKNVQNLLPYYVHKTDKKNCDPNKKLCHKPCKVDLEVKG